MAQSSHERIQDIPCRTNVVSPIIEQQNQRRKSFTTRQNIRDVCGLIFIPGMIGILTIAIAIVQLHIASRQRQQDLTIAEANRLNSLMIANYTREQDLLIANTLRWDTIFAGYVDDISSIIDGSNFSFDTSDYFMSSIIRAKTMTAGRQLDTIRKTYLIQFLYELKAILSHHNPIDLTGLELNNIDLSMSILTSKQGSSLAGLSLTGVSLIKSSFIARELTDANFTGSNLQGANFRYASLHNVSFRMSIFPKAYSIFGAILPNKTFGIHSNLLKNGNAEEASVCIDGQVQSIDHGDWNITPSDSIGVTIINKTVAELAAQRWLQFHYKHASISQLIDIPKQYHETTTTTSTSYSWFISLFCGIFQNQANISITLNELNSQNQTLSIHNFVLPYQGNWLGYRSYNENSTYALFKLEFYNLNFINTNSSTLNNQTYDDAIAFCDNIHLSLELSSVVLSVMSIRML
ncbi:hypothetical protein I4U23_015163 [Adineta vaga]|nr:hypothetical protein I4U23_015163 [Adineta vaga]